MNPVGHVVVEKAIDAKKAHQQGKSRKGAPVSGLNRAIAAGIWAAAGGTLAALLISS